MKEHPPETCTDEEHKTYHIGLWRKYMILALLEAALLALFSSWLYDSVKERSIFGIIWWFMAVCWTGFYTILYGRLCQAESDTVEDINAVLKLKGRI